MLRDNGEISERPWSRPRRLVAAGCLIAVAVGVMTLRGPARGTDDKPSGAARPEPPALSGKSRDTSVRVVNGAVSNPVPRAPEPTSTKPIDLVYVPENMSGLVAFRPAAIFRRAGMAHFATRILEAIDLELAELKKLKVDPSKPGHVMLRLEDIEWVTCGIQFGRAHQKNAEDPLMHTFMLGVPTVRTVRPFDWLAFLRSWGLEFVEVREPGGVYHKITGQLKTLIGPNPCVYLPDDRTIVLHEESAIQKLIRKGKPEIPAHLSGPEWDRASRGLLAVVINNHEGAFAKNYDLGRPDDAVVLSLFKGVDRWVFGVDDADAIALNALAFCGTGASESLSRAIESLVKLGREALEDPAPEMENELQGRALQMVKGLLANLQVGHGDGSVELHTEGFGTLAEFGELVEHDFYEPAKPSPEKKVSAK